jgi:hypothetical protein
MANRREFDKRTQVAIIKRSTVDGKVMCERCNALCRRWEIHHITMDALEVDKSRKLSPCDGVLLCKPCHDVVTKAQAPVLAKVLRVEAAHLGAKRVKAKIPSQPRAVRERKITFVDMGSMQSQILRRYSND